MSLDAREIDLRLTALFEQLEAIDADPTIPPDLDSDKPIPFEVYERLLENGYEGPRPTLNGLLDHITSELRSAQRHARLELLDGDPPAS